MVLLSKALKLNSGKVISVSDITNKYKQLVADARPVAGRLHTFPTIGTSDESRTSKNDVSISLTLSATSCDILEAVKMTQEFLFRKSDKSVTQVYQHNQVPDRLIVSKDGNYTARLTKGSRQLLEIWKRETLLRVIDTSDIDEHGVINLDNFFGNFSWHNGCLLYACQKKKQKHLNYFKPQKKLGEKDELSRGDEFNQEVSWGESLTNVFHTVVGIYNAEEDKLMTLEVENESLATPQWFKSGEQVVCVGYQESPRKIGLVYCNNIPSHIYILDVKTGEIVKKMEKNGYSYHSPRVNNGQNSFIYLSNKVFGPHVHAVRVMYHDTRQEADIELANDLFIEFPRQCFSTDDKFVVGMQLRVTDKKIVKLNVESKKLTKLVPKGTCQVLDFKDDLILYSSSRINSLPVAFIIDINDDDKTPVRVSSDRKDSCLPLRVQELAFNENNGMITAMLISLENSRPETLPTVCVAHGGPHSAFTDSYVDMFYGFCQLEMNVLLINYRGSTGIDQKSIEVLCGNIGSLEVADCLYVIKLLCSRGWIDKNKLVAWGGSHSGLITAFLSCQQDVKFKCCIMRNPVIDIVSMFSTTDIPFWTVAEPLATVDYSYDFLPNKEEFERMFLSSPMSQVAKAHVPTLMMLGNQDQRVPNHQGERWVDMLRAKGVHVECKVYNDKHSLDKPETMADAFVTAAEFILRNLSD